MINLNINVPSKSLTHVLILAVDADADRKPFQHNDVFKNIDLTKASLMIEGQPNQLYASGMLKENTWGEIRKLFPGETEVTMEEFLTTKYALCYDLRPSIDPTLHGCGLGLLNTSDGLTIQLERTPATSGTAKLNLHIFLLQDAQLNILNGRFNSVEF